MCKDRQIDREQMVGVMDGLSLSGKAEDLSSEPKANRINSGASNFRSDPFHAIWIF